jgi:hypothetical protein
LQQITSPKAEHITTNVHILISKTEHENNQQQNEQHYNNVCYNVLQTRRSKEAVLTFLTFLNMQDILQITFLFAHCL